MIYREEQKLSTFKSSALMLGCSNKRTLPHHIPEGNIDMSEVQTKCWVMYFSESNGLAIAASYMVKVNFSETRPPIVTIEDAIAAGSYHPNTAKDIVIGDAEGISSFSILFVC